MSDENQVLASLLEYVRAEQRVCPMPFRWTELWEMLPGRKRSGSSWEPPPPLILAAWWDTPSFAKMERLAEHINYAHARGALGEVDRFLRTLPEGDWAHLGEFLSRPAG